MAPMAVYSWRFIAVWVCLLPLALIANSLVRRDWRPQFSAPLAALLAGVVLWQGMTWFLVDPAGTKPVCFCSIDADLCVACARVQFN